MAAVANSADQAVELLQKFTLEPKPKSMEIPEPTKKATGNQYGSVDNGNAQIPSYERSLTPVLPEFMDPAMCYLPNGYPSTTFYYGGYEGTGNFEWEDFSRYMSPDGVDLTSGVYGDNGSLVYHHGYGYAPYAPYSPAGSPVPTMGNDGQLYGPQHYQYPPYFQPLTPTSGPFTPTPAVHTQGEISTSVAADQKPLSLDTSNGNSNVVSNGVGTKGRTTTSAYQDPRFGFDGARSPVPWLDAPIFSDGQPRPVTSTAISSSISSGNNGTASRNQTYRPNSQYMGLHHPRPMPAMGANPGFMSRMYPNKLYGQYGNAVRSGMGYGAHGYDSRTNGRAWLAVDNKYKTRGRNGGYFGYGNENTDGLNELNRGPRAKGGKNQKVFVPTVLAVKGQNLPLSADEEKEKASNIPDREQYNKADFPEEYTVAKFFVIKSYSEDDIHKSIKYNVWASTQNGNKKLDGAYQEAQQKPGGCPIFLLFSVNTSGQFVGLAEMIGPVDFNKSLEYWQQDKWNGCFPLKWHIVKDVPNNVLRHITLQNNENKPVTNSRDTQEVLLEPGLKLIKLFKEYSSKTCILDDFGFYEGRQKTILEKKAKQQFPKQVWVTIQEQPSTMGNMQNSLMLQKEEIEEISKETGFSKNQIVRLYSRFLSLDKQGRGYLDREDLLRIPELAINPLGDRIVDAFFTGEKYSDHNNRLNFRQFINVLAHFRPINKRKPNIVNSRESKLRFAFSMYDLNKNNYITKEEFKFILNMMVGSNITAEQLDHIAERTISEADVDKDGKISFEEFCKAMERTDIDQKMSIRFLN